MNNITQTFRRLTASLAEGINHQSKPMKGFSSTWLLRSQNVKQRKLDPGKPKKIFLKCYIKRIIKILKTNKQLKI